MGGPVDFGDPRIDDEQVEIEPWFAVWCDDGSWAGQAERQRALTERIGATFGDRAFVAEGADVVADHLSLGPRSYIAAGCQIRDHLTVGHDTSLNPHVTTAGTVTIGNGVRIASHAALYGFNHTFDDLDTPIWLQPLTVEGIVVEDDVWIGTHVVVCDGVTIGAHSVVAAGAVVTRDVPPWSVVAGVPARVLRDRRDADVAARPARRSALDRLDTVVAEQWPEVLRRCAIADDAPFGYVDRPGAPVTTRARCDAIEIAGAFGRRDAIGDPAEWIEHLQALQDPATGLFPDPAEGIPDDPLEMRLFAEYHHYGVLSVGYALEVLGSGPARPVGVVEDLPADELLRRLDALPWADLAWPAGSWVDFLGTATYLNRRHHGSTQGLETLFGWLQTRQDRRSGMWGEPNDAWGWLMPVNGFYRLTRGTYAQFGEPIPRPEAVVDTVIAHAREHRWFVERDRNACNVLDVVHPLWLCLRQVDYRTAEIRDHLAGALEVAASHWVDGAGFSFAGPGEPGGNDDPGLQGTEMWLSIIWLAADAIGESDGLSWRPRGVHRPEPADSLRR
ncbi:MAG: acyltransferase [Acidimicrobiia bacterium]|nr:acyltransferase [Acidimicrobiia bacterium]